MSLIKCPECKKKISNKATSCPYCGYPIRGNATTVKPQGNGCASFLVKLIIVIIVFTWVFIGDKVKDRKIENEKKSSIELFCADLRDNFDNYKEKAVTISVPVSSVSERTIKSKDICSVEMDFDDVIEADISEGDYITITGIADYKGLLNGINIKKSTIVETGENAKKKYNDGKDKYLKEHPEPTRSPSPTPSPEPQLVSPEDSISLYCLDLYENCEKYNGKFVTISAPIRDVYDDTIKIKGETTGEFSITLLEPRSDLKNGTYITVIGLVDGSFLGTVDIVQADVSAVGKSAKKAYRRGLQKYEKKTGRIIDMYAASEEDFKANCKEMDYRDIVFSEDSLEGQYVKLELYMEEPGIIDPEALYDTEWMELIQDYSLDRTSYMVGIRDKETGTYGGTGDTYILFTSKSDYTSSDFKPGMYITFWGKIAEFGKDLWEGHNSAYFVPRFIEVK